MIYWYTCKGRLPSEIYNLPEGEKAFLYACILKELEEKKKGFFSSRLNMPLQGGGWIWRE